MQQRSRDNFWIAYIVVGAALSAWGLAIALFLFSGAFDVLQRVLG